jgi:uncharacterized protein YndB with AHSA1/START domain
VPIKSIESDPETLTLTAIGEFEVPVERLWNAWSDPRQLERFWGPEPWPATFTRHDMKVGGRSEYYMTGPEGQTSRGYWVFEDIEPGQRFAVRDGFAHDDGSANDTMPGMRMEVRFEKTDTGSRFVSVSTFPNLEAMEKLVAMGMVEGLQSALAQLDDVLADLRELSKGFSTELEVVDDTHVLITREVRGSIQQVWRAHHEPELMKRWLLGPDGWQMPVCEVATKVGDRYRYEWQNESDEAQRFGFVGELLHSEAPRRAVTTEQMIGMEGEPAVNELILTPRPGGRTKIAVKIEYPSKEIRDMVLDTGMVDGMETSYARLEREVVDAPPATASA